MDKDLKCLFITLPQRSQPDNFPPYGAMAVMTSLRKAGYKQTYLYHIEVLRPSREDAIEYIVRFNPDVLCISAPVSTGYENCKFFSTETKRRLPGLRVVVGGNLAASAEILLKKAEVDFCVLGEGEKVCRQLFDRLSGNGTPQDFYNVKGLVFLDGDKLVNTGYAEPLAKEEIFTVDWDILDSLSIKHYFPKIIDLDRNSSTYKCFFPDHSNIKISNSTFQNRDILKKTIGVISCSKGCVARCTFCHRFNKGIRFVPPETIIARIEELIERFNVGAIVFGDECFGANIKWLRRFCELIKPLNLLWKVSGMRVNMVTPEIVEMMKDAGCRTINYGMETGSEKILQTMEKKVSLSDNYNAMTWTIEAGVHSVPAIVIGMPGETPSTIKETAEFLAYAVTLDKSQDFRSVSINFAQALPGTPLYEYGRCKEKIGSTLQAEEAYLLNISDRNAADAVTTINFTDYPRLTLLSWPFLILCIVKYRYAKKFGIDHYYKIIFQHNKRSNILEVIKNRNFKMILDLYPGIGYGARHFLLIAALLKALKTDGTRSVLCIILEYVAFVMNSVWKKRNSFEYTSLRKILEVVHNPYKGTKEMEPLRRGR